MKKLLLLTAFLTGCASTSYPVELPHGIHGTWIRCSTELECQKHAIGLCQNGYWIAEKVNQSDQPNVDFGEVIVCDKSPGQQ